MERIKYLLILIFGLLVSVNVYANELHDIKMDIYLNKDGTAHIKETWQATLSQGTEGYKPYYNLGDATITNFKVEMGGSKFSSVNYWNTSASFNEKAYKSGINHISKGLELCWGISKYGKNTYVLEYDINGFVVKLNDADMVYWTLIPEKLSNRLGNFYIKIYSDHRFADNLDVWGYGNYGGYAYVYDGYIELSNENGLYSSEYVVTLIKFPLGTFNTKHVINADFDYYLNMAEEGATHYDPNENNNSGNNIYYPGVNHSQLSIMAQIFNLIFGLVPFIFIIILVIALRGATGRRGSRGRLGTRRIVIPPELKLERDVPYFRDIPCDKNIFNAYWVAGNFHLMKRQTDFLGALLLKWLKEDRIQNVKVESRWLKKEISALKFVNKTDLVGRELDMYEWMVTASKDGILEPDEFKRWCSNNYTKVLDWFDQVFDQQTDVYLQAGFVTKERKKSFILEHDYYNLNLNLKEEATRMKGLKKFLVEFSNIHTRESIEVKLWEYYLMYAQIFGIAKKVAAEFKRLYPDVITDEYYNNVVFVHSFSNTGVSAASSAKSRAESYSSTGAGGGGWSSGGGGGGSFGGGGGGGGGFR